MNTPITESYARHVHQWDGKRGNYRPAGIMVDANLARRLELDRRGLIDALEEIAHNPGDCDPETGFASGHIARAAIATARANFPTQ